MSRKSSTPASRHPHVSLLAGIGLPVLDALPLTDDGATLDARTALAAQLNALIDLHTRDTLPSVIPHTLSRIRGYRLRRLSIDQLLRALVALDQHVEITVRDRRQGERPGLFVIAEGPE